MRTKEEIQSEYGKVCAVAGHVWYQLTQLESQLEDLEQKLLELNKEASKSGGDDVKAEQST